MNVCDVNVIINMDATTFAVYGSGLAIYLLRLFGKRMTANLLRSHLMKTPFRLIRESVQYDQQAYT